MAQNVAPIRVTPENGKFLIAVPIRDAEAWQTRLRKAGVRSTILIDPLDQTARLELWPGMDPKKAQAVLDGLAA